MKTEVKIFDYYKTLLFFNEISFHLSPKITRLNHTELNFLTGIKKMLTNSNAKSLLKIVTLLQRNYLFLKQTYNLLFQFINIYLLYKIFR